MGQRTAGGVVEQVDLARVGPEGDDRVEEPDGVRAARRTPGDEQRSQRQGTADGGDEERERLAAPLEAIGKAWYRLRDSF